MKYILTLLFAVASPAAACSVAGVCADVSSFSGVHILDGFRVSWSTDDEPGTGTFSGPYRLIRQRPNESPAWLADFSPVGSCSSSYEYAYTDKSGPPSGTAYTLEVWSGGSLQCSAGPVTVP